MFRQPEEPVSAFSVKEDEKEGLMAGVKQSVFNKTEELKERLNTGADYRVAAFFLMMSVLFFFLALSSLPLVLIRPGTFNLYFCFGSMFLQLALAFFYAPMQYLAKIFSSEGRVVSGIYFSTLITALYLAFANYGYIVQLSMLGVQGVVLSWFVTQTISGASAANNSIASTMALLPVLNLLFKPKEGLPF